MRQSKESYTMSGTSAWRMVEGREGGERGEGGVKHKAPDAYESK